MRPLQCFRRYVWSIRCDYSSSPLEIIITASVLILSDFQGLPAYPLCSNEVEYLLKQKGIMDLKSKVFTSLHLLAIPSIAILKHVYQARSWTPASCAALDQPCGFNKVHVWWNTISFLPYFSYRFFLKGYRYKLWCNTTSRVPRYWLPCIALHGKHGSGTLTDSIHVCSARWCSFVTLS